MESQKNEAVLLRKQGKTYTEISKYLNVGKSTLSGWLKDIQLSKEQKKSILAKRPQWIENYKNAVKIRNKSKMEKLISKTNNEYGLLSKRDWEIAGTFLYWGEGEKGKNAAISVSNTNPDIILFAVEWLHKCYRVDKKDLKLYLHVYRDMDINSTVGFWSEYLKIDKGQFAKPYIKKSSLKELTYHGYGHGTCRLYYGSVKIKTRILSLIKVFAQSLSSTGPVVQW